MSTYKETGFGSLSLTSTDNFMHKLTMFAEISFFEFHFFYSVLSPYPYFFLTHNILCCGPLTITRGVVSTKFNGIRTLVSGTQRLLSYILWRNKVIHFLKRSPVLSHALYYALRDEVTIVRTVRTYVSDIVKYVLYSTVR